MGHQIIDVGSEHQSQHLGHQFDKGVYENDRTPGTSAVSVFGTRLKYFYLPKFAQENLGGNLTKNVKLVTISTYLVQHHPTK
jgi:hypothetical protein